MSEYMIRIVMLEMLRFEIVHGILYTFSRLLTLKEERKFSEEGLDYHLKSILIWLMT